MVNIDIQITLTWPQKMAATSAMAIAPESPVTPTPLQLKNIYSRIEHGKHNKVTKYSDYEVLLLHELTDQ